MAKTTEEIQRLAQFMPEISRMIVNLTEIRFCNRPENIRMDKDGYENYHVAVTLFTNLDRAGLRQLLEYIEANFPADMSITMQKISHSYALVFS